MWLNIRNWSSNKTQTQTNRKTKGKVKNFFILGKCYLYIKQIHGSPYNAPYRRNKRVKGILAGLYIKVISYKIPKC